MITGQFKIKEAVKEGGNVAKAAHFGVRKCVGIKSATVLQKFKNIKQWINKALLHISQRLTASCTR